MFSNISQFSNYKLQNFCTIFKILYHTIIIITDVQSTRQGVCQPLITSIVPGGQDSVRIEFEDYE